MYLLERMNHWARTTPSSPAVVFEGETVDFRAFQAKVENTIALLENEFGIRSGDRVAYLGINHPNMLYFVFACSHLGAIFTPYNSRLAEDEYRYLIENSDPSICFYDEHFAMVADLLQNTECMLASVEHLNSQTNHPFSIPLHKDDSAPLLLVYTSGTTGKPKGVLLSNKAVAANIENGNALYNFQPDQNILVTLPLFHVGGLCILLLPALTQGATIHLHSKFDPWATIKTLSSNNITTTILVPAQMAAMMALPDWDEAEMPAMKYVVVGSSLIPMSQIKAWHAKGIPVSQVYGATETGPTAIGLHPNFAMSYEGSAGQAAHLCSIEVRREDKSMCATNENGDIWVKGPNILSAYWRNQEETDLVLQDGWYNTGDIGHIDEDGFYWIVDRSKDVIISGGENIYPAEVEAVALQHPSIKAIAVVGKRDPHWGETPVAAVELRENTTLEQADFKAFLKDKIAKFKQPKSIVVFDVLPRNGMGKIEKSDIRKSVNAAAENT